MRNQEIPVYEELGFIGSVKQDLFTLHGLAVTILTNLILAGALGGYIFFRVQILGKDVALSVPDAEAYEEVKPPPKRKG